MARKPGKLAFILATVLAAAAFITINTWAVAKREDGWKALSATGRFPGLAICRTCTKAAAAGFRLVQ
jgi:hypothetical protein